MANSKGDGIFQSFWWKSWDISLEVNKHLTFTTKDVLRPHSVIAILAVLALFTYHVILAVASPTLRVTVSCSWHSATCRAAAGWTAQRIAAAEVVETVHATITCPTDHVGFTQALILEQGENGTKSVIFRTEIVPDWVTNLWQKIQKYYRKMKTKNLRLYATDLPQFNIFKCYF